MIRRTQDGAEFVVIDAHIHTGESAALERYRHQKGRSFKPDQLIELLDHHGMDATVAFGVADPKTDYSAQNQAILDAADKWPRRIIPFARMNPHFQSDAAERVRAYAEAGVRGLKMHPFLDAFPINDPVLVRPIVEEAAAQSLAVLFHCGEAWTALPGLVYALALDYPDVRFIIAHAGHRGFDVEATALAARADNIWLDTSVLYPPQRVNKVIAGVGRERVLFGSDSPFGVTAAEIEKIVRFSGLSEDDIRAVLGGNLANMLDLDLNAFATARVVDYPLADVRH